MVVPLARCDEFIRTMPDGADPCQWCDGWERQPHGEKKHLLTRIQIPSGAPGDCGEVLYLCPKCLGHYRDELVEMNESTIPTDEQIREGPWAPAYASGLAMEQLKLEVRDLTASQGEFRMQLNGAWKRVVALEGRVKNLESGPSWTGTIDGLEGEMTITPIPKWEQV